MKKGILFLFILGSLTTRAQSSLKDLLYSGKLKSDSNTVVRKTDDLSTKIDTAQKKVEAPKPKMVAVDSSAKITGNASTGSGVTVRDTVAGADNIAKDSVATNVATPNAAPAKTNTKIWKEYSEALAVSLKAEVLSNKKIKKETYFFMVEYELEPTGQVSITNVTVTPENDLLAAQVKQRMETTPPQMNADPNQTKKVKRRYSFSVTKD